MRIVQWNARRKGQLWGQFLYTPADVARMTGLSLRTVRRHIAAGQLRTVRQGGRVHVTAAAGRCWWGRDLNPVANLPPPTYRWCFMPILVYAAITKRTTRQIRHLIDKGALTPARIEGRLYIRGADVADVLKQ